MQIIDFHAHIFPDNIAERASGSIADFYGMPVLSDGKVDTLLKMGDVAGVQWFVVHSVATVPGHAKTINQFITSQVKAHPDRFIGFAALHPDMADLPGEVQRAIDMGLRGIKLHPDIQRFALTEPRAMKMFESFAGKLPALIHTGDRRYRFSRPSQTAEVLRAFPNLQVVGAHLGGWSEWEDASLMLAEYQNFRVDCSSSLYGLTPEEAARIVRRYGADRVLFGSDFPMWTVEGELEKLRRLNLTPEEMDLMLQTNAARLLGLAE